MTRFKDGLSFAPAKGSADAVEESIRCYPENFTSSVDCDGVAVVRKYCCARF